MCTIAEIYWLIMSVLYCVLIYWTWSLLACQSRTILCRRLLLTSNPDQSELQLKKKSYPIKEGIYTTQIETNFYHAYLFKSRVPSPTLRKFSFIVFDTFVTSKVTVMVGDGCFQASLVTNSIIFCYSGVLSKWEIFIKMRTALFAPIHPQVMKKGESQEGSSHFDEKTLILIGHYGIFSYRCLDLKSSGTW